MKNIGFIFKSFTFIQSILFLFLLFILSSCFSVKPGSTKSAKNLYETFYVGEDGIQYFIKPLVFKKPENKEEIKLDFTFRYKESANEDVTMNYNIQINEIIKKVDSIVLLNPSKKIKIIDNKLLFNEKIKRGFKSRFSTKTMLSELMETFKNNEWEVILYANGKTHQFYPTRKTKKNLTKLNDHVFILFQ